VEDEAASLAGSEGSSSHGSRRRGRGRGRRGRGGGDTGSESMDSNEVSYEDDVNESFEEGPQDAVETAEKS